MQSWLWGSRYRGDRWSAIQLPEQCPAVCPILSDTFWQPWQHFLALLSYCCMGDRRIPPGVFLSCCWIEPAQHPWGNTQGDPDLQEGGELSCLLEGDGQWIRFHCKRNMLGSVWLTRTSYESLHGWSCSTAMLGHSLEQKMIWFQVTLLS